MAGEAGLGRGPWQVSRDSAAQKDTSLIPKRGPFEP